MGECIEREAVLKAVQGQRSPCRSPAQNRMLDCLKAAVIRISAADVAPVVHGRWVFGGDGCVICSKCNEEESNDNHRNFCPNCGAKMDGGDDHAST